MLSVRDPDGFRVHERFRGVSVVDDVPTKAQLLLRYDVARHLRVLVLNRTDARYEANEFRPIQLGSFTALEFRVQLENRMSLRFLKALLCYAGTL